MNQFKQYLLKGGICPWQTGKKLKKGNTPDVIADELETDISKIQAICEAAKQFAPDYDTKMIFNALEAGG